MSINKCVNMIKKAIFLQSPPVFIITHIVFLTTDTENRKTYSKIECHCLCGTLKLSHEFHSSFIHISPTL